MGTQNENLDLAEDYIGHTCRHHSDHPQKGTNDLLILTQPDTIEEIHFNYAVADHPGAAA